MVEDAQINVRGGLPFLALDGEPFPYLIDKAHGVKVEAGDDDVHLLIVAIQVNRSVTIVDASA